MNGDRPWLSIELFLLPIRGLYVVFVFLFLCVERTVDFVITSICVYLFDFLLTRVVDRSRAR